MKLEHARKMIAHIDKKRKELGIDKARERVERVRSAIDRSGALLVVGSSLMVLSDVPPKWHEIPLVGLLGFVVSGILGFYLLYTTLRHGKL